MLCELIPRIAAEEAAEKRAKTPWRPRCSESGVERCVRQSVYKSVGAKAAALRGRTALIFDDGEWAEEVTLDWIRKSAFKVHSEQLGIDPVFVPGSHPGYRCYICDPKDGRPVVQNAVHGHLDAMLTDPLGVDWILEHKTTSRFAFARWAAGESLPWDYITQACLYVRGVRLLGSNCSRAILLIKNKDTAAFLEFILLPSPDVDGEVRIESGLVMEGESPEPIEIAEEHRVRKGLIATAIARFAEVCQHREARTLPPRPFTYGDWHCDYCPFGAQCWEGYQGEMAVAKAGDPIVLEGALLDLAFRTAAAASEKNAAEKLVNGLKDELNVAMSAAKATAGRGTVPGVGDVTVDIALRSRESIDKDRIPPAILKAAVKTSHFPVVTAKIRRS